MGENAVTAETAVEIVDQIPRTASVAFRRLIESHLVNGHTDPAFMQGMLTGLKFAQELLLHKEGREGPGTLVLTDLTIEVAHHYLRVVDEAASRNDQV